MATATASLARRLADVEDPAGCAVSLYLDRDPSTTPTPAVFASRLNALLARVEGARPEHAPHDARLQFEGAVEKLRKALTESPPSDCRVRGAAAFALGEEMLELRWLPHRIDDLAVVATRFALLELAGHESRHTTVLTLIVSREEGRLWRVQNGCLELVFDDHVEQERRHNQGGWEQADLQRWADRAAAAHVRDVVDHLEHAHVAAGRPPVVISASEETAAMVDEMLGRELSETVVARTGNERDRGKHELLEQAAEMLLRLDSEREADLLNRWREQQHREQNAPRSPGEVLAAIVEGRVEWLLAAAHAAPDVFRCPRCGLMDERFALCPLDGEPMAHQSDGIQAAVAAALGQGGRVWRLLDPGADDLSAGAGMAAILRF